MLVYEGIKEEFMNDVDLDVITSKIYDKYREYFGRSGQSQINSWRNSMEYMYKVLNDEEIPKSSGVAIEFNIPTTSKRIDFILSGVDEKHHDSAIIIELKQWEKCTAVDGLDGIVSTFTGRAVREVPHPSYQVMSYANLIRDFNETVQDDRITLCPCVYLHNYSLSEDDPIKSKKYKEYIDEAPMFGNGDVKKLRDFIKKYIHYGDNKEVLYKIESGKLRPSKRLQDSLKMMLKGNKVFTMIDEQKVIYEKALALALSSKRDKQKNVLIVKGGPGTGKSVLAINLLVKLTDEVMVCNYVTKNAAPRNVFYKELKGNYSASYIKNLFKSSGIYVDCKTNTFDALIVDEAHRLQAKSGMFKNLGESQIKEIINSAYFSIFFIDEAQRVTTSDVGSIDLIKKYAKELNAKTEVVELESQFRCNGSNGYLNWLDNVLEIRETANYNYDFDYQFKIYDNPNELRSDIFDLNKINNKSRIVAGYCWNWDKANRNDSASYDITIPEYNFGMSWNLGNTDTWAIDKISVNEAGCIHTCQGLDFDYVGVIIGDDLRYENDRIITDFTKRAKTDQSLKGIKKLYKANNKEALKLADEIIKNTYKTLMTRGIKGCFVYCTNKELAEYLKMRLKNIIK